MNHKKLLAWTLFFSIFCLLSNASAYTSGKQYIISGKTMGTYYSIKFISKKKQSKVSWKSKVSTRLKEVNKRLSMFDPKSELSLFNREEIKKPVKTSSDFYTILQTATQLYNLSNGSWDGTVKPLVDLWGFGTTKVLNRIPEPDEISLALSKTGFHHIEISAPKLIMKKKAVSLDLGSIAKGYGVDAIAKLFTSSGIHDVLVEIGGELYASGKNKKGKYWSVGISRPDKKYANQGLYKIIRIENMAIATSGNYRNFFEIQGKAYSHILNPETGFPVDNKVVSASVLSKDCTFADGLATALMVMDVKEGIALVNRLEDTECLIIQKNDLGLLNHTSERFNNFVITPDGNQ